MDHLRGEVEQGSEGREGFRGSWHRGCPNVPFAEIGEMARLSALFEHSRMCGELLHGGCQQAGGLRVCIRKGTLTVTSMLMSEV